MHIQQSQHNKYGQIVGEDTGTAYQVQQDVPEGMVRRAIVKATCMATDNTASRIIPSDSRSEHRVHEEQFRRGQRATHIQGLRDSEDATEPRILARKRGRKYAK